MITAFTSERWAAPTAPVSSCKVIGLGNAGLAMLARLDGEEGAPADLLAVHTDARALSASPAPRKLQIGPGVAKGLGAGGDAARGRASASESITDLRAECGGTELLLLCAGLGGGTGSGAAPVVAEQAKKAGALVVALVTLPFAAEGSRKRELAEEALIRLGRHCLTVLCFENDRMFEVSPADAPLGEAFGAAAGVLSHAVRAVTQMLCLPALMPVGLDELLGMFEGADARAHLGYGVAGGADRARAAVEQAMASPLLDEGRLLAEPGRLLLHLTGDQSVSLAELQTALKHLSARLGPSTQVHVGVANDADARGRLAATILACTHSGLTPELPDEEEELPAVADQVAGTVETAGSNGDRPAKTSKRGKVGKKAESGQMQEELPLDQAMRGRFKDLDPTMVDGEDLDIPTFIRMRIRLK